MQTTTQTTSIQSSSLDARIESPLVYKYIKDNKQNENEQHEKDKEVTYHFVHDTYLDFFLAKYFADLYTQEGKSSALLCAYLNLDERTFSSENDIIYGKEFIEDILKKESFLLFYSQLSKDAGSFNQMIHLIDDAYNSCSKYDKINETLFNLTLSSIVLIGYCFVQMDTDMLDNDEVNSFAEEMCIPFGTNFLFNTGFNYINKNRLKRRALDILIYLERKHGNVVSVVTEKICSDITNLNIDGEGYIPDYFDVLTELASVASAKETIISFLEDIALNEERFAQLRAFAALNELDNARAITISHKIF